jgi:putative peptidoglycan lipid II flippase
VAGRKSAEGRIAGGASVVGSATLLSRVFGYVRDFLTAFFFGAGLEADAFFVAFRVANLLRRLVGEGALTSSFVPIFTDELERRGRAEAAKLASRVFTLFFLILVALSALGMAFSTEIVRVLSPGFETDPEKFALTAGLTRWLFPYMVAIGMVALSMGVLNSLKHFAAPALSPVLLNAAMIAAMLVLSPALDVPIYSLVYGVIIGGCLQFAMQLPFMRSRGFMPRPAFGFSDPAIKKIFTLMGPAAIGVGVYQLNIFVTMYFASSLPEGSVSYLYYSSRLMELPLGVFAVAIATAALPALSEHAAKGETAEFKTSLAFALRLVNFVTIPATIGFIMLSSPIIEVLFQRGEFGANNTYGTAYALWFYALGLVPVAATRVLVSVFYAMKDTRTPVVAAFLALVGNVIFSIALMGPMTHGGLALATTLAACVNFAFLFYLLRRRFGRIGAKAVLSSSIKSLVASAVMGAVILALMKTFNVEVAGKAIKSAFVIGSVIAGAGVYVVVSVVLKNTEIRVLKGFIR